MDFEGDGALPYFESSTEAVQAALTMRDTIATESFKAPHPVAARHEHYRGTGRVRVDRLSTSQELAAKDGFFCRRIGRT